MLCHKCYSCLFGADCKEIGGCEDYMPIDEDYAIERYIEDGREEYRAAWEKYVAEDRVPLLC